MDIHLYQFIVPIYGIPFEFWFAYSSIMFKSEKKISNSSYFTVVKILKPLFQLLKNKVCCYYLQLPYCTMEYQN